MPAGKSYSSREEERSEEEDSMANEQDSDLSEKESEDDTSMVATSKPKDKGKSIPGKNLAKGQLRSKGGKKQLRRKEESSEESEEESLEESLEESSEESEEDIVIKKGQLSSMEQLSSKGQLRSKANQEEKSKEEESEEEFNSGAGTSTGTGTFRMKKQNINIQKFLERRKASKTDWSKGKQSEEERKKKEEREKDKREKERMEEEDDELPEVVKQLQCSLSGRLVVAVYENEWFVGIVCEDQADVPEGYKKVSYSSLKGSNIFSWPEKKDIVVTVEEDIILKNVEVEPINSRGHFSLYKKDHKKVLSLMVVVYFSAKILLRPY